MMLPRQDGAAGKGIGTREIGLKSWVGNKKKIRIGSGDGKNDLHRQAEVFLRYFSASLCFRTDTDSLLRSGKRVDSSQEEKFPTSASTTLCYTHQSS